LNKSKIPLCIIEFEAWLVAEKKTLSSCLGMVEAELSKDMLSTEFFKKLE